MTTLDEVSKYIDANVLHSTVWDSAAAPTKSKAVNNARVTLQTILSDKYADEDVPVDDLAWQAVWLLKMDDSFQRAEMGVHQMTVDGVTVLFRNKDNTVAPQIGMKYGISLVNGMRRRTASYRIPADSIYRIPVSNGRLLAEKRK